ncbi:hypothetical protein BGZ94_008679 [Podila epigama]|nr:hypothetical protein BGZ94_008679 [Podila epigama]
MKFNTAVVAFAALVVPAVMAKTVDVNVVNGKFVPQDVDIVPGDSVRWPNNDGADHAIVETIPGARTCNNKAGGFNSGRKTKGQAYQRIFRTAGVVNYKDGIGANCLNGATGTIFVGPRPNNGGGNNGGTTAPTASRTAAPIVTQTTAPSAASGLSAEKSILLGVACFIGALVL